MKTIREKMLQEMQMRNYSPRTIETYLSSIKNISTYFKKPIETVEVSEFKGFLHQVIHVKKHSVSTLNQHINAFRLLCEDILQKPWNKLDIKRPKREKKLPFVISKADAKRLVNNPKNIKHRCILMLGYSSGLRISEVVSLRIADIDSTRMQIQIRGGKGRKDRYTILSPTLLTLLRDYYKTYRPIVYLFEGGFGKNTPYSVASIRKITIKAAHNCKLSNKISFHTLRHCFATHLLENGTNIQIIQKLLGHASVRTTCTYLHVQNYALENVKSPLDN